MSFVKIGDLKVRHSEIIAYGWNENESRLGVLAKGIDRFLKIDCTEQQFENLMFLAKAREFKENHDAANVVNKEVMLALKEEQQRMRNANV